MSKHNPRAIHLITRYIKECGENGPKLQKILDDHMGLIAKAQGSLHKHQAWPGGYLQHVADCMSLITMFYNMSASSIYWPIPFSRASAFLVLFLHDIHEPFMQQEQSLVGPNWEPWTRAQSIGFVMLNIIAEYDIILTKEELRALVTMRNLEEDYNTEEPVMNELAGLCHMADIGSSRVWHSRKKSNNN